MLLHAPDIIKCKMHAFRDTYICGKTSKTAMVCGDLIIDPFQMSIYNSFVIAMKLILIAKMSLSINSMQS